MLITAQAWARPVSEQAVTDQTRCLHQLSAQGGQQCRKREPSAISSTTARPLPVSVSFFYPKVTRGTGNKGPGQIFRAELLARAGSGCSALPASFGLSNSHRSAACHTPQMLSGEPYVPPSCPTGSSSCLLRGETEAQLSIPQCSQGAILGAPTQPGSPGQAAKAQPRFPSPSTSPGHPESFLPGGPHPAKAKPCPHHEPSSVLIANPSITLQPK